MEYYDVPLIPGPVSIPTDVLSAYSEDYGSADAEEEFYRLYGECEQGLQKILHTRNQIAIMSGEGMLALWGALKSVVGQGDRVLAVATGVFGYGIAAMAADIGASVEIVGFDYDDVLDAERVRDAALRYRPKLITVVHCETPSGILNPIAELGSVAREVDGLLYVDFVASAGGAPVEVDDWGIDLGLLGSQKVLSCMPDLAMVTVSDRAWAVVDDVGYVGYDALRPWKTGVTERYLPYTHCWHAMAGLRVAINKLKHNFDLSRSLQRHSSVSEFCVRSLGELGVEIWPRKSEFSSPTVTAAKIPEGWTWHGLDRALREHGMAVGGSYGPLQGRVFRIGHMGSQADMALVTRGLDILESVLSGARR